MSHEGSHTSGQTISVVIVDDHPLFREGIHNVLRYEPDIRVLGEGGNGKQAIELAQKLQPDVMLMDINLPMVNGIQATRQMTNERLHVRVVLMTAYDDQEQLLHGMRAGAASYCAKDVEPTRLVEVLRYVAAGHYVVGDQVLDAEGVEAWMSAGVEAIAGPYYVDPEETFVPLSPREMEILRLVTRGMSNKEIARELQISHQTVKNHMTSVLKKLAVEDRTQAAVFALRRGWVRLQDTTNPPKAQR
jgi:DNA-binding NarL/FixJ family response regulator